MQCTSPDHYNSNGVYIGAMPPCGKCLACLSNARHAWAARLMLERKCHEHAQFITFTFDDDHLPDSASDLKRIWQLFVKRFRKADGQQPRYFTCLEYGTRYGRPHFHSVLFGRQTILKERIAKRSSSPTVVRVDPLIEDKWGLGSTFTKACDSSTAATNMTQYVVGYVLKNKWLPEDSSRQPEWALQSRAPYIGQPALKRMRDALTTRQGSRHCAILGTVPQTFRMAGRYYRLPRRMRLDLAESLGYPCLDLPYTDGTVIDIDGVQTLKIIGKKAVHQKEALARQNRMASRIRSRRKYNTTTQTG